MQRISSSQNNMQYYYAWHFLRIDLIFTSAFNDNHPIVLGV
jgi:hypothetical protein